MSWGGDLVDYTKNAMLHTVHVNNIQLHFFIENKLTPNIFQTPPLFA